MPRIDTVGPYRGEIVEAGVAATKKGYPQWIARIKATEKYVDDPEGMEYFELKEPDWVDWSQLNEDIVAYLVLFNDAEEFSEDTSLCNYEQLQAALGWDGTEFDSLNDDSYIGKTVMFRVEEDEYDGKVSLRVNWIDAADASPRRELRKLDADGLKDLSAKLKIKKKPKSVAKPASKPKAGKPGGDSKKPPVPPKKSPPKDETPEEKPDGGDESGDGSTDTSLPSETSQGDAWEFVCEHKGGNSDSDVEEAWISACGEVGGDKDEDDFTDADWAKVRDLVIKDLALDV